MTLEEVKCSVKKNIFPKNPLFFKDNFLSLCFLSNTSMNCLLENKISSIALVAYKSTSLQAYKPTSLQAY